MMMDCLSPIGNGMKVLYVEDDPLGRDLLTSMLQVRFPGLQVINAENGEEGLKLYLEQKPDMVLTDIHMPELDGVKMAERIKDEDPNAVIIIITAHSDTSHLLRAIELGINRYILKPIDNLKLFETMENAISAINMEKRLLEQQMQLQESREMLNAVIETNGDAVYIKDLNGRYLIANTAAADMIGKKVDEIVGCDDTAFFPAETAAQFRRNDSMVIKGGSIINFEETITDSYGDKEIYLVTKGPLRDSHGNITATFGVTRNITERKRYQEEIERHNAELEQRVKERTLDLEQSNNEMEAFCHAISHELRAPIARLEGFHNAISECLATGEYDDINYYMERLSVSTEQLKSAVDALLTMNRLTRVEISLEPVNLSYLSQQVMIDLMEEFGNLTIHFAGKPDVIVDADRKLLTLCMYNLLGNALKYSSRKPEAFITFGSDELGEETVYFIKDNGAGFDMKYAENLFKPFSRLHHASEFEGTGIGLATVHRIIEKHRGRIWIDSKLDEGTTVFFTLGSTLAADRVVHESPPAEKLSPPSKPFVAEDADILPSILA